MEEYYSQIGQDKYLQENIFKGFKNGIFVDVGAHDGLTINNTYYFEKNHNWTGINIEPLPSVFKNLVKNRSSCKNCNCAIDTIDGFADFIQVEGYSEMLSGLEHTYDKRHLDRLNNEKIHKGSKDSIIKVVTKRLDTIFDECNLNHVHYLTIDVEGAEFNVIKSIDFSKVFIDIIEFENNYNDVSLPIIEYLKEKGYEILDEVKWDIIMIHKDSIFKHK